jgi:hypothetical protein
MVGLSLLSSRFRDSMLLAWCAKAHAGMGYWDPSFFAAR